MASSLETRFGFEPDEDIEEQKTEFIDTVSSIEKRFGFDPDTSSPNTQQVGGEIEPFDPRAVKQLDIKGFEGEPRTDNLLENIGIETKEILQSYAFLGKALVDNPIKTAKLIGENFLPTMIESYTRWVDAAEQGKFLEALVQHPVQAIQDLTLPISLIFSGGASGLALAGKSTSKIARSLSTVAKISDRAAILTDPIGGLAGFGLKKAGGQLFEKATGKSLKVGKAVGPDTGKPIDIVPDLREALDKKVFDRGDLEKAFLDQGFTDDMSVIKANAAVKADGMPFRMLDKKGNDISEVANSILRINPELLPESKKVVGNIRLEKYDTPEGIKRIETFLIENDLIGLDDVRNKQTIKGIQNQAIVDEAKLRTVSNETGIAQSDLVGSNSSKIRGFTAVQLETLRVMKESSKNDMMKLASEVRLGDTSDLKTSQFMAATERFNNVVKELSGGTAEIGRAMRILRETPKSAKINDRVLQDVISAFGGKNKSTKLAEKLWVTGNAEQIVAESLKATKWDRFMEVWINGLLSGPQTHAVNAIGNTATTVLNQFEELVATGISATPFGSGKLSLPEAGARIKGMLTGISKAARQGWAAFLSESSPELLGKMESQISKAIHVPNPKTKGDKVINLLGKVIRVPGGALGGSDIFYKGINYSGELAGLAMREARQQGISGIDNIRKFVQDTIEKPPKAMEDAAMEVARKNTFTNQLGGDWLTDFGKWVQKGTQQMPLLRVAVPFIRTPANIAKFALERTPLALTFRDVRKTLLGPKSVARDQAWARVLTGSALGYTAAWGASNGNITGGAPSNTRERQLSQTAGFQQYSFKSDKGSVAFGRIEPLGMIMGAGADLYRLSEVMTSGEIDKTAALITGSAIKNLSSKTFLRGVTDMLQAMNDPDRYMERWVQNFATSLLPFSSLIASGTRAIDPTLREADGIFERANTRYNILTGFSDEAPPRRNIWGEPIVFDQTLSTEPNKEKWQDIIQKSLAFVNPIYMKADPKDKVTNFMIDVDYFPGVPSRRIQNVEMTAEEYSEYAKISGQQAKAQLDLRASTPEWDAIVENGTIQQRENLKDYINRVIDRYRTRARKQVLNLFPELRQRIEDKRNQQ